MQAQQNQSTGGKWPLVTRSATHSAGTRGREKSTRTRAANQPSRGAQPAFAVAAIDGRGNLLLRDDRFDGDLAQATRHARTLASALADRHRLMVTATVTERATGRRVVTWTSWGAL